MKIEIKSQDVVYITIKNIVFYIDLSTNEIIFDHWLTDENIN